MERIIELMEPPIVGREYLVPCVTIHENEIYDTGNIPSKTWVVPVFGTVHSDPELGVAASRSHLHIDQRFVDEEYLEDVHRIAPKQLGVRPAASIFCNQGLTVPVLLSTTNAQIRNRSTVEVPRVCHRELPDMGRSTVNRDGSISYWTLADTVDHAGRFEDMYEGVRLKDCKVCPHRGIHLGSIPERNGMITCPGHCMDFDAKTGEFIRRTKLVDNYYKHADIP